MVRFGMKAGMLLGGSWVVGIVGYKLSEGMNWIDAILNSAMILGGMGQVTPLYTTAGKLFASFYSIFSGVVFLVAFAVLLAPVIHRLMHRLHFQDDREWN